MSKRPRFGGPRFAFAPGRDDCRFDVFRNEPFIGKIYPDAGNSFELVAINDVSVSGACKAVGLAMPELKPNA